MKFKITDKTTGDIFEASADEHLLMSMKKAQKGPIKHGCFGGGCGVCKIRVLEGEFDPYKRMSKAHVSDEDIKNGIVLSCCIKPKSDLVIEKY